VPSGDVGVRADLDDEVGVQGAGEALQDGQGGDGAAGFEAGERDFAPARCISVAITALYVVASAQSPREGAPMTRTVGRIDELRAAVDGRVIVPGEPGYDEARTLWNADVERRPSVVVLCASASDVVAALRFAQEAGLEVAVRGGGHSAYGASSCDDGLMIHLGGLNKVTVDPVACRARCGGGATLGDLDAATQEHGLAVPLGSISHTGVGGLTSAAGSAT
jgi:hypothetical protein